MVPFVVTTKGEVVELRGQLCREVGVVDPRAMRETTNAQVEAPIIAPKDGVWPVMSRATDDSQSWTR
jgi:hypothetical protein